MKTVFHKNFGKGQLISDDNTHLVINFENLGEKKLLKKFANLLTEEKYQIIQSTPKPQPRPIYQQKRHKLKLMSESSLISVLKGEEDSMQKNYYFDIDEVVNSEIYTDGVDYYSNTKELIGDSWKLAMYFAKEK
jgi:hypothetical protein